MPPLDAPVLDWWADDWDHVFVALNPFYRVPGAHPSTHQWGPIRVDRSSTDGITDVIENSPEHPQPAPDDFEKTIKATGEPVRWSEVASAIGATDFAAFARAAWLHAIDLEKLGCDLELVALIKDYCAREGVFLPESGEMPMVMIEQIGGWLASLGIESARLWSFEPEDGIEILASEFARAGGADPFIRGNARNLSAGEAAMMWDFDETWALCPMSEAARSRAAPDAWL